MCFFNVARIVSRPIDSTICNSMTRSVSKRTDHREYPFGGAPHAIAMMRTSFSPVTIGGFGGEARTRLRKQASMPSVLYCLVKLNTVSSDTPHLTAISFCVGGTPTARSAISTTLHRFRILLGISSLRNISCTACRSASLNSTWYFWFTTTPPHRCSLNYIINSVKTLVAYLPCTLNTKLNGVTVQLSLETDYPFGELICLRIFCSEPTEFAIALRIPQWVDCAELIIGEQRCSCPAGSVQTIRKPWRQDVITLRLPMKCRVESGQTGVSIFRRALLYALQIQKISKRIHADIPGRELPHGDFEKYPASEWRYALDSALKPDDIGIESKPLGTYPFAPDTAPVVLHLPAYRIDWPLIDGCVQVLPDAKPLSGMKTVSLIPYGCTNIRHRGISAMRPECSIVRLRHRRPKRF